MCTIIHNLLASFKFHSSSLIGLIFGLFLQLTKIAQDWSDLLLSTNVLKHRPSSKLGENLWTGSGFTLNDLLTNESASPVNSWYAEIKNYPSATFQKWGKNLKIFFSHK